MHTAFPIRPIAVEYITKKEANGYSEEGVVVSIFYIDHPAYEYLMSEVHICAAFSILFYVSQYPLPNNGV
jgi:hypothetical protein